MIKKVVDRTYSAHQGGIGGIVFFKLSCGHTVAHVASPKARDTETVYCAECAKE